MKTIQMKINKPLLTMALIAGLFAGLQTPVALADSDYHQSFSGIEITQALTSEQLVQLTGIDKDNIKGSIKVPFYQDADDMASKVKIDQNQAVAIAVKSGLGKVIKSKLEEEEGYLAWEIKILGNRGEAYKILVDAGNGKILFVRVKTQEDDEDAD